MLWSCNVMLLHALPSSPPLQRPLSAAQVQYAAADAACLLALLGSFIAAVGQPEEWPMSEPDGEAAGAQPAAGAAAGGMAWSRDIAAAPDAAGENAAEGEGGEAEGAGGSSTSSVGNASEQRKAAGFPQPQQEQQEEKQQQQLSAGPATAVPPAGGAASPADLLNGCTLQQLEAAASAWGVRLEISGARAVKRGGRRGQRQRREARRGSGRLEPEASCAFPLHVPFWDSQRQVRLAGGLWVIGWMLLLELSPGLLQRASPALLACCAAAPCCQCLCSPSPQLRVSAGHRPAAIPV